MVQQPQDQRYDDTKINRYFLHTLETANIPNEDWKGFITFTGKTWLSITKDQLFAEARTYYNITTPTFKVNNQSMAQTHI